MITLLTFQLQKLFDTTYLFYVDPTVLHRSDKIFFAIGAIAVVLAGVLKLGAWYAPNPIDRRVRERVYTMLLTIGLLEIVWFGARIQNIRFFGTHFAALVILLIGVFWLVKISTAVILRYRRDKAAWEKEQIKLKYLPK